MATLRDLEIGKTATIVSVGGDGALRQHFLDMGLIPGEQVSLVKFAPMGDPMELMVHGYELTLRLADAENIGVTDVRATSDRDYQDDEAERAGAHQIGRAHV